jgi:putative ABC transport system permease protein
MIRFFLKGLMRDRNRSLFPVIIVSLGVMITVMFYCYMRGAFDGFIASNARLDSGHVKIMTRAYNEIANQLPNDLALSGVENMLADLKGRYPGTDWAPRIKFGGLIDFPDDQGETRAQGPVFGIAVDLINSGDAERLQLAESLASGRMPTAPGEMLLSHQLAEGLGVKLGETATLIGSTASGSMAVHNFILVGTLRFGVSAMDRNAMIAQLADVQCPI